MARPFLLADTYIDFLLNTFLCCLNQDLSPGFKAKITGIQNWNQNPFLATLAIQSPNNTLNFLYIAFFVLNNLRSKLRFWNKTNQKIVKCKDLFELEVESFKNEWSIITRAKCPSEFN